MSSSDDKADLLLGAPLSRAELLVRRLVLMFAIYAGVIGVLMLLSLVPARSGNRMLALSHELIAGGLGAAALSAVVLTLTALAATALLTTSRLWHRRVEATLAAGEIDNAPPTLFAFLWKRGPGFLARQGQAVLVPLGALAVILIAWLLWPSGKAVSADSYNDNLIAALIIALAFPALIAERTMVAFPADQMPEAPGLRRLLLMATVMLAAAGVAEIGRGVGFGWTVWVQRGLILVNLIVAGEIAVRALARLFLPAPAPETARAASDSLIATILTAGPRSPGSLIRTHLGIDFARSWALSYLVAAAVPALAATLFVCWLLTGVKLLAADQRGVYERFGTPVAVLQPGFHFLAPWPLGRLRPVEYGTVHTLAVGVDKGSEAFDQAERAAKVRAEDTNTSSLNRLWETSHATEAEYLVASLASGQQGFQMVNTEILVLYRTGMNDAAARQSVYGSADQATVVEQEADRLALRYFSSHTLDGVLGAQRDTLQAELRSELAKAVDADQVGVEIVAVLIDEVHPPAGAAAAYHHVQAAGIDAQTSAFQARAHASRTAGQAQQEAHQATTAAEAVSVEKMQAAEGDAYQFTADRKAYTAAPNAFLLERQVKSLAENLPGKRVMIIDHNLNSNQVPLIDMRGSAPAGGPAGGPGVTTPSGAYAPDPTPSTSSERPAPASTSEQADAD